EQRRAGGDHPRRRGALPGLGQSEPPHAGADPSHLRSVSRRDRPGRVGRSTWDVDWGRTSRPGSRVPAAAGPRKVRAPPGTVVGNTHTETCAGECRRKQTAVRALRGAGGKGERVE